MLSSIASFLPSALHLNNTATQEYQQVGPTINPDTEDEDEPGDDDVRGNGNAPRSVVQGQEEPTNGQPQGAKGAGKSAYETFIFVRPPPSKSNHPLNLQVQLVPPHGRPPTGVGTQDDATTPTSARSRSSSNSGSHTGTSLVRTNSKRSEVYIDTQNTTPTSAAHNINTNTGSTSSFSSTASFTFSTGSSSSGRRTIIPLYNLQAHNVMTNVIVDAGTDAKIARFQKRGLEMMEVGVLEPVEVWGEKERGREKGKKRDSIRLSVDEVSSNWSSVKARNSFLLPGGGGAGGSRPVTPSATSSKTSLHSSSHSNLRVASPAPMLATFPVPLHTDLQHQQQHQPILDSTTPTPIPVLPPQQVQFMTQAPPQKRNIFNKLFNKRSSLVPPPPPSTEPDPTFAAFSLHPAPVTNKVVMAQDFDDKRGGGGAKSKTPPSLVLGSPPQSPSSQTTPRQTQMPRMNFGNNEEEDDDEGLVSPAPTIAPPKERGHGRNSSLTVPFMNNPFKTTLIRSGKNRLSAVVGGGGGGGEKEKEKEDKGRREERKEEKDNKRASNLLQQKRDASPANVVRRGGSRTQLNLPGGGSNVELNGGGGVPLMLTQSQAREELSNLKQQQLALRPPILGIQPTFVSPAIPPPPNPLGNMASPLVAALSPRMSDATQENLLIGQRALMYVWLVRKWLKRRPVVEGEGGHVFGESGLFAGLNLKGNQVPGMGHEVRFEWKRAKVKGGKEGRKIKRGRASTGTNGVESDDELAARTTEREKRASISSNVKERLLDKRRNRMSTGSFSTTTASEEGGGGGGEGSIRGKVRSRREGTIDDGEDSDPEDSETPWVCTLKIRRMVSAATDMISPPSTAFSDAGFPKSSHQPQVMRLKVGTLSPTPHHPKVVAMLKVPFPLPDVEVERMGVVRRKGFASQQEQEGEEEQGRVPYYGLTLTAEEIKDIVCSTGLWLVVREGFGGVGKVSRKGDGWRIRA